MGSTYRLPDTLSGDIREFALRARKFEAEELSAAEFKTFHVPMGVYEQRKDRTYMARVRTTGGVISPSQFLRLVAVARAHGSNLLHLTTRQEVQVQNLRLDQVEPVLYELSQVGLATKGGGGNTVRNMLVSELSGIGDDETFDTTPYAQELTSRLLVEPDSYTMPRKMKIAFSSSERHVDYAAINDVGLVARVVDGHRGFSVYVGGGAGARPTVGWLAFDFVPAEELYALVKALKNFFLDYGDRENRAKARIRFIFYRLGEEETLRLVREYFEREKAARHAPLVPDLTVEERPVYAYNAPQDITESEAYRTWRSRYVTPQRQTGYYSTILPILVGNLWLDDERTPRLERLLAFLQIFGDATVRFTNTQNLRLRNLPEAALPELYALLRDFTDEVDAPVVVNNMISCTGADMCRLGVRLSKSLVTAIRRNLLESGLDLDRLADVTIHVTGCPNSCGQQLWADLGFAGRTLRAERPYPAYQVFLSAERTSPPKLAEPVGNIAARRVPDFVRSLLAAYLSAADDVPFALWLKTDGRAEVARLLEAYAEVPDFADDPEFYTDWGAVAAS